MTNEINSILMQHFVARRTLSFLKKLVIILLFFLPILPFFPFIFIVDREFTANEIQTDFLSCTINMFFIAFVWYILVFDGDRDHRRRFPWMEKKRLCLFSERARSVPKATTMTEPLPPQRRFSPSRLRLSVHRESIRCINYAF